MEQYIINYTPAVIGEEQGTPGTGHQSVAGLHQALTFWNVHNVLWSEQFVKLYINAGISSPRVTLHFIDKITKLQKKKKKRLTEFNRVSVSKKHEWKKKSIHKN